MISYLVREVDSVVSYILLLISIGMVVLLYGYIFIKYLIGKKKNIGNYSSFDIAKEITDNYDSINIVSSSDVLFSEYDIKRNVIRLNSKVYDSNNISDIGSSAMLAGFSLVNQEYNNYFCFKFIIRKINIYNVWSLIGVVLSYFVSNIGDAYIGVVMLGLLAVYQYLRYSISVLVDTKIREVLNDNIYMSISASIRDVVMFNKVSFIVMLVLILRLFVIIFGM